MRKIPYTPGQMILEILCAAGLIVPAGYLVFNWGEIPEQVATHFNFAGLPDAWGGKAMLWILLAVAGFLYLLFSGASALPMALLNLPVALTEENKDAVGRAVRSMLLRMKLEMLAAFGYVTITNARGLPLEKVFLWILLGVVTADLAYGIFSVIRVGTAKKEETLP